MDILDGQDFLYLGHDICTKGGISSMVRITGTWTAHVYLLNQNIDYAMLISKLRIIYGHHSAFVYHEKVRVWEACFSKDPSPLEHPQTDKRLITQSNEMKNGKLSKCSLSFWYILNQYKYKI